MLACPRVPPASSTLPKAKAISSPSCPSRSLVPGSGFSRFLVDSVSHFFFFRFSFRGFGYHVETATARERAEKAGHEAVPATAAVVLVVAALRRVRALRTAGRAVVRLGRVLSRGVLAGGRVRAALRAIAHLRAGRVVGSWGRGPVASGAAGRRRRRVALVRLLGLLGRRATVRGGLVVVGHCAMFFFFFRGLCGYKEERAVRVRRLKGERERGRIRCQRITCPLG
ncbi:hypothetical protein LY76DRAFT_196610 [Colletotrichum caudatum]|nr:hypothetical protein LY76DRAFT_196610 [Colletotrichum caudatum]